MECHDFSDEQAPPKGPAFEREKEWMGWEEQASCKEADPENFTVNFYAGRLHHQKVVQSWCSGCKVKTECYKSASVEDLAHTIRGGVFPDLWRKGDDHDKRKPPSRSIEDWKFDQDEMDTLDRFLCRGCPKGIHELNGFKDVYVRIRNRKTTGNRRYFTCRQCNNLTKRLNKAARSGKIAA